MATHNGHNASTTGLRNIVYKNRQGRSPLEDCLQAYTDGKPVCLPPDKAPSAKFESSSLQLRTDSLGSSAEALRGHTGR